MLRRLGHILLAASALLSVASLLAWPASFYEHLLIARLGSRSTVHCSVVGGQIGCVVQTGPGLPEVLANAAVQPTQWFFDAGRNHVRYTDSRELWKDSMSFGHMERSMAMRSGAVLRQHQVIVPLWFTAWLFAMPPGLWLRRYRRRRDRIRRGLCLRCGYDLRASPDACPECGFSRDAATLGADNRRPVLKGETA